MLQIAHVQLSWALCHAYPQLSSVHECCLSESADGAAVLPSCTPAEMQAAPRQESGSCLGCLDPFNKGD